MCQVEPQAHVHDSRAVARNPCALLESLSVRPTAPPLSHERTWHAPWKHVPEPPVDVVHKKPPFADLHWPSAPHVWQVGLHRLGVVVHMGCGDGRSTRAVGCASASLLCKPTACPGHAPAAHAPGTAVLPRTSAGWQTSSLQNFEAQSLWTRQALLRGHGLQAGPPQSGPVSSPLRMPSSQAGGCKGGWDLAGGCPLLIAPPAAFMHRCLQACSHFHRMLA